MAMLHLFRNLYNFNGFYYLRNVADEDALAIVPFEPLQSAEPDQENVLSPDPISVRMPADIQLPTQEASSSNQTRRPRLERLSRSDSFDFILTDTSAEFCLKMDQGTVDLYQQVIKQEIDWIPHCKTGGWLSFPSRLEGWRVEKCRRARKNTIDHYFLHPRIATLRSESEVKFYIKYGFVPEARKAGEKRSIEEASLNPKKFLQTTEERLLSLFKTTLLDTVDKEIADQLKCAKEKTAPPPSDTATTSSTADIPPTQQSTKRRRRNAVPSEGIKTKLYDEEANRRTKSAKMVINPQVGSASSHSNQDSAAGPHQVVPTIDRNATADIRHDNTTASGKTATADKQSIPTDSGVLAVEHSRLEALAAITLDQNEDRQIRVGQMIELPGYNEWRKANPDGVSGVWTPQPNVVYKSWSSGCSGKNFRDKPMFEAAQEYAQLKKMSLQEHAELLEKEGEREESHQEIRRADEENAAIGTSVVSMHKLAEDELNVLFDEVMNDKAAAADNLAEEWAYPQQNLKVKNVNIDGLDCELLY